MSEPYKQGAWGDFVDNAGADLSHSANAYWARKRMDPNTGWMGNAWSELMADTADLIGPYSMPDEKRERMLQMEQDYRRSLSETNRLSKEKGVPSAPFQPSSAWEALMKEGTLPKSMPTRR